VAHAAQHKLYRGFIRDARPSSMLLSVMASITIRRLDEKLKARLRIRAAQHGRFMEQEAREILRAAI